MSKSIGRRRLLLALGSALVSAAFPARAQSAVARIGFLAGGTHADTGHFYGSFLEGLRQFGYQEGRNVAIDARYAEYSAQRAAQLAADIAARKPAVIVTNGGGTAPAFRLSPPIPMVFLHSGDPVVAGFAESYARPARHATGVSLLALDLIVKRMELLKQILPNMRKVAFLASPEHAGVERERDASHAAAAQLNLEVTYYQARNPVELDSVLPAVASSRPDAAVLFSDALMIGQRKLLADFFLRQRIPSVAGWSGFADSGHVLAYGPERHAVWRRLAYFVDKILKGAQPGAMPIELPTAIEMVINRRAAMAMNLTLPAHFVLRADRVID